MSTRHFIPLLIANTAIQQYSTYIESSPAHSSLQQPIDDSLYPSDTHTQSNIRPPSPLSNQCTHSPISLLYSSVSSLPSLTSPHLTPPFCFSLLFFGSHHTLLLCLSLLAHSHFTYSLTLLFFFSPSAQCEPWPPPTMVRPALPVNQQPADRHIPIHLRPRHSPPPLPPQQSSPQYLLQSPLQLQHYTPVGDVRLFRDSNLPLSPTPPSRLLPLPLHLTTTMATTLNNQGMC